MSYLDDLHALASQNTARLGTDTLQMINATKHELRRVQLRNGAVALAEAAEAATAPYTALWAKLCSIEDRIRALPQVYPRCRLEELRDDDH